MEPPGNHQVQHQPQLLINSNRDSLADATESPNRAPFNCTQRRIYRTQQEHGSQPDALQRLTHDPRFKGSDVCRDIRQFRHDYKIAGQAAGSRKCVFLYICSTFSPLGATLII